ncbi:MAG: hypothetical protein EXS42_06920 [Lacunisphaera sp.]|nr:hypothetical protein [Lacunisphaera sp.]
MVPEQLVYHSVLRSALCPRPCCLRGDKVRADIARMNSLISNIEKMNPKEAAKLRQAMDPGKLPKDD